MNYKLLVLDLDGTTVEPNGDAMPSEKVIASVKKAQKLLHVAIATGRPLPYAQKVINALGLKGLGVVNGGSEIVDMQTGKIEFAMTIDTDTLKEITKICLPFGYKLFLSSDQYGSAITSPDDIKQQTEKFFIDAINIEDSFKMLEELESINGIAAHPTKSWTSGNVVDVHITHEHATKRYGVERLIEMLGFTKEEVIAIGDDHNDVPLMMAAGTRVAMGNAPEQVKSIADFVTDTLANDGVAVAIEKYIIGGSIN